METAARSEGGAMLSAEPWEGKRRATYPARQRGRDEIRGGATVGGRLMSELEQGGVVMCGTGSSRQIDDWYRVGSGYSVRSDSYLLVLLGELRIAGRLLSLPLWLWCAGCPISHRKRLL